MLEAAPETVHDRPPPKKPWISKTTLDLIEGRSQLASREKCTEAAQKDKEVKRAANEDRKSWAMEG
eukprot:343022-Alexandrium_andersonii.AAC.1